PSLTEPLDPLEKREKLLNEVRELPLILTSSSFSTATHGQHFVDHYCRRLGVKPQPKEEMEINFLISTTMDPWTTDTSQGGFLGVIEQTLRDVAHDALDDLIRNDWELEAKNA